MAARRWTQEQRQRQAEAIRRWKPWTLATGPTTLAGKAKASRNGDKGGEWRTLRDAIKMLNGALREQKDLIR
jgi:hypothetical protein